MMDNYLADRDIAVIAYGEVETQRRSAVGRDQLLRLRAGRLSGSSSIEIALTAVITRPS